MPLFRTKARPSRGGRMTYQSRKRGNVKYIKKTARKNPTYNKTTVSAGLGFPKRMVMTHKYVELINLTSTSGVIQKYLYSANGMYDPNITGTGHQPTYFDQMSALYNHYTVIGSKIKVRVTPVATNEDVSYVGMYLDDDTTTTNIIDTSTLGEATKGTVRQIPPNSNNSYYFSGKWSAKKTFGGSILGNDNLQGNIAANPTEQSYWVLASQAGGGLAAVDTSVQCYIEISYIAVWEELKQVAQS